MIFRCKADHTISLLKTVMSFHLMMIVKVKAKPLRVVLKPSADLIYTYTQSTLSSHLTLAHCLCQEAFFLSLPYTKQIPVWVQAQLQLFWKLFSYLSPELSSGLCSNIVVSQMPSLITPYKISAPSSTTVSFLHV